ncbi:MAG: YibE/F family protein [Anaerolineae bacterium]|nr:YibE/F family protein [Anaerolineae bacterium]MBL6966576.1 YibE/F family protein [Anaerolineales bacterium]
MNKGNYLFWIAALVLVGLAAALIWVFIPRLAADPDNAAAGNRIGFGSDAVRAEIVAIVEEGTVQVGNVEQEYQLLRVELLEGDWAGTQLEVDYGKRQTRPEGLNLDVGDRVIVSVGKNLDGYISAYFMDFVRTRPIAVLFATFVLFSVLISGWKGVRGLMGMAVSLGVIVFYIIPQILRGHDPLWVSVSGAFFLLAVTLYLVYGWTLKTHAAVLGTLLSLVITALLAGFFVDLTRLTGFGNEDALFLVQQADVQLNLRGLVLGGMLIGALGVLDDLVITQASVVFELHGLDSGLKLRELYQRAMRVGQDHVAATVNTLVLAYAGAALPMFLLFSLSGENFGFLLNLEYVAEEVVRTLVGSLGLFAAVPLTTLLSCLIALYHHRLGAIRRYLGPETGSGGHSHSH